MPSFQLLGKKDKVVATIKKAKGKLEIETENKEVRKIASGTVERIVPKRKKVKGGTVFIDTVEAVKPGADAYYSAVRDFFFSASKFIVQDV